ncbi:hypothetical protein RB619_19200 [Flavobacterium sp. LHD-80]|uniref:hypothetical protein n=1 Tax=Flavobacterium sp. LHD-80 TaxID=3071411 RepID=UPI0027E1E8D6|nr:hypothetical protein [Flavobacterium sp. LHD-80]MDQ6472772.1 hypothetical protein [Flavobacterium sp. LHD-80]
MKTATSTQDTIGLDKIEKNTNQILEKINNIRPTMFKSNFKLSKKAEEEKAFLSKNLAYKSLFSFKSSLEIFTKILEHANFSKLEKNDQDFVTGLEKLGFKDSLYIKEINDFIASANSVEDGFPTVIEETIYFNLLNSELNSIERRLDALD